MKLAGREIEGVRMNILRLRIIVPIFLLHLIALPFLLFQYMVRFEQPVWEAFGQSMLAELQRRIAIHQLTGESNVTEVQRAVDEFSGVYRFLSLRVYNSKGSFALIMAAFSRARSR